MYVLDHQGIICSSYVNVSDPSKNLLQVRVYNDTYDLGIVDRPVTLTVRVQNTLRNSLRLSNFSNKSSEVLHCILYLRLPPTTHYFYKIHSDWCSLHVQYSANRRLHNSNERDTDSVDPCSPTTVHYRLHISVFFSEENPADSVFDDIAAKKYCFYKS